MKKKNLTYIILIVFLSSTFLLSFIKKTNLKTDTKGIFLIQEKVSSVNFIQIVLNENELVLEKNQNGLWNVSNGVTRVPANQQRVEDFVKLFSTPVSIQKTGEGDFSSYESENGSLYLNMYFNDGSTKEFVFGKKEFSGERRFIHTENKIYKCDTVFDTFLTTSETFWSEKLILSQNIKAFTKDDIQRIVLNGKVLMGDTMKDFASSVIDLRYSSMAFDNVNTSPSDLLKLELGDKSEIIVSGFGNSESENPVKVCFSNGEEYLVCVSSWTYNKLFPLEE